MSVYFCSLGFKPDPGQEQAIPTGTYTTLRFPYGTQENADPWNMHPARQPDGKLATYANPESGLIWPTTAGLGCLELDLIWMAGDYSKLRDVFVRNPLVEPDETAYDHRNPTTQENVYTKTHWLIVKPSVPLAVRVAHDATGNALIRMAQFKLTIFDNLQPTPRIKHRHSVIAAPDDMA